MISVVRRYRYVVQDRDRHGNVRIYLRRPGQRKQRLHETPGTDAFDLEYRRALEAKPKPEKPKVGEVLPGSINALCISYYRSAEFKRMGARSQRVRRLILDRFRETRGHKPAGRLEARHLVDIRDEMADRPEAANGLLKALRAVYRVGIERGLVSDNPAAKTPYLASRNPDGVHCWTLEEVAQFERHHKVGSKARLALALLIYTGQRRSDVVLLGRQHVRDGWLTFTQVKGRARKPVRLSIPIVPELQEALDSAPSDSLTFLTTERGGPYSAETFGNAFRRWCRDAGLPQCSPHGLRKAAASRLAELGASSHEIMAITGHLDAEGSRSLHPRRRPEGDGGARDEPFVSGTVREQKVPLRPARTRVGQKSSPTYCYERPP